ncbi:unnamed protein product [Sphenostylis stenocarpa]|uniref:Uncharacterized protein n=1 Tax=Sphenostylis stenocarpa TaxID=92480 RepID=A0AA86VPZ2_9FABA|nr:unnamed protein product [Sphenostylis stenocarpa]
MEEMEARMKVYVLGVREEIGRRVRKWERNKWANGGSCVGERGNEGEGEGIKVDDDWICDNRGWVLGDTGDIG